MAARLTPAARRLTAKPTVHFPVSSSHYPVLGASSERPPSSAFGHLIAPIWSRRAARRLVRLVPAQSPAAQAVVSQQL